MPTPTDPLAAMAELVEQLRAADPAPRPVVALRLADEMRRRIAAMRARDAMLANLLRTALETLSGGPGAAGPVVGPVCGTPCGNGRCGICGGKV